MTEEVIEADVLIIGGGPAGCACALYTARSSLSTIILDKNPAVGALAITHQIANYPGTESVISGAALLEQMRDQAISYGADYRQAQVFTVETLSERKAVYTPDGIFYCRALVLATGAMGKSSTLPGEDKFLGRGVSYCATCDGAFFKNREVVIYGANQEAVDEGLVLTKFASTVHWVTNTEPRDSLSGLNNFLGSDNVQRWQRTRLLSIEGDDSGVNSIMIKQQKLTSPSKINAEGVFIYSTGTKPITDYLHGQVPLLEEGGVRVDSNLMTDIDGVWAIGDIRNTPFKQAVVACADGCIAAMAIDRYLNKRSNVRVDWVHR